MNNYVERIALVGLGLWLGLAASRTEFQSAAIPIYVVVGALFVLGRWAVVRHRDRRDAQRAMSR